MRIISRRRLRDWSRRYPDARNALNRWCDIVEESEWNDILEARRVFPSADAVVVGSGRVATVFNIRGNHYRLIAAIHYDKKRVFLLNFLTHTDYDGTDWKGVL